MKKIQQDTNKWKDIACPRTKRFNNVKMSIYPKQSTDLRHLYQNYDILIYKNRKKSLNIMWNHKGL